MADEASASLRGVTQTLLAGRDDDVPGNCLQAAVATLFDRPLGLIPHFVVFIDWQEALRLWLRGFSAGKLTWQRVKSPTIPDERCLVMGKSPRGLHHICVGEGGKIVWDPHPSRSGLVAVDEIWLFTEKNAST